MKKVYRFSLIPGVEFIEEDEYYYAASDEPIWPKSHITKVIIDGLLEYEKNNTNLYDRLEFTKKCVENRDKTIEEKDKEIKTHKNNILHLNDHIEYIKRCAENEINHRNKLLDEKDKEIEAYKETIKALDEENSKLNKQIIQSPISKSPISLSSAEDCSDFYICAPDHIAYGPIAGGFGIGLYVGDTLILLKGDKASEVVRERSSMTDKINTLEATIKKKDETIEKLSSISEFADDICDGYGALTNSLMNTINEKDSEIKVLSDQVTRLMDQIKEVMGENGDTNQRVKTETKPETNFDKIMRTMYHELSPTRLAQIIKTSGCQGVHCNDCPFNTIAKPYSLSLCDMPLYVLAEWLSENAKED